ncbi:MAG: hypothetical protein AAB518_00490 [Patescibacteria group bacterium]
MERLRDSDYFAELTKRSKKTRAYAKHQVVGLEIADILGDRLHKSLYIKLAKEQDASALLRIAKSVAEKKGISNQGAYFMRIIANLNAKK